MHNINIKQKIIFIPILAIMIFLSGCSSMNSSFDCQNKPGVTCRSLDQVNDMVDRGLIGRERNIEKTKSNPAYLAIRELNKQNLSNRLNSLRQGEQVVRVWIAPYQDVSSNYHNESTLYTVVRKNNWAVPKEIIE